MQQIRIHFVSYFLTNSYAQDNNLSTPQESSYLKEKLRQIPPAGLITPGNCVSLSSTKSNDIAFIRHQKILGKHTLLKETAFTPAARVTVRSTPKNKHCLNTCVHFANLCSPCTWSKSLFLMQPPSSGSSHLPYLKNS